MCWVMTFAAFESRQQGEESVIQWRLRSILVVVTRTVTSFSKARSSPSSPSTGRVASPTTSPSGFTSNGLVVAITLPSPSTAASTSSTTTVRAHRRHGIDHEIERVLISGVSLVSPHRLPDSGPEWSVQIMTWPNDLCSLDTRVEGPFSEVARGGGLLVVKAIDSEQEVGIS